MAQNVSRAPFVGKNNFPPLNDFRTSQDLGIDSRFSSTATLSTPSDQFAYEVAPVPEFIEPAAPPAHKKKRRHRERWNWWYTVLVVISVLACPACLYCTLGALVCNITAYVDHKAGRYEDKKDKLRCSIAWSIGSFAAGCAAMIIVLIVLFTAVGAQNWNILPAPPAYAA